MSDSLKGRFAFVSLGCPKNLVDSERMLGKLAQDGYTLTPDADGADVVVVHTCGFIELAADGVRELIVVAQDTTYYGLDLYGHVRLAELLRELDRVEGLEWVRILYAYPIHFTDELIETLAGSEKVLPYLDLPLQHINDRVLRRMQRKVDRKGTEELLRRLRGAIPN